MSENVSENVSENAGGMSPCGNSGASYEILSSNAVKLIALILMTADHAGMILFPAARWLRYIGRPALPLFAYMVSEGCTYTRSRARYFLRLLVPGLAMAAVYAVFEKKFFFNIFMVFSVSVALCTAWDKICRLARQGKGAASAAILFASYFAVWFAVYGTKKFFGFGVGFDGGFFGIMLPVAVYAVKGKWRKLAVLFLMCLLLALDLSTIRNEWIAALSVIVIIFYNGERGKLRLREFFYCYYPAHIAVMYLISVVR